MLDPLGGLPIPAQTVGRHLGQERWWDQITARYGDGTKRGFADGHSDYWKWKDPRTVEIAKMDYNQCQRAPWRRVDSAGQRGPASRAKGSLDEAWLHTGHPTIGMEGAWHNRAIGPSGCGSSGIIEGP